MQSPTLESLTFSTLPSRFAVRVARFAGREVNAGERRNLA